MRGGLCNLNITNDTKTDGKKTSHDGEPHMYVAEYYNLCSVRKVEAIVRYCTKAELESVRGTSLLDSKNSISLTTHLHSMPANSGPAIL